MRSHTYMGVEIHSAWPVASTWPGAARPDYERWEAFITPNHRVAGHTLTGIKSEIRAAKTQQRLKE